MTAYEAFKVLLEIIGLKISLGMLILALDIAWFY